MKIAVLGTGMVGQAVAAKLSDLGHDVTVGTRDPQATLARTDPDGMGNPPFPAWLAEHPAVRLAAFAEAAERAELLVNATNGGVSIDVLTLAARRTSPARSWSTSPTRWTSPRGSRPPCSSRTPTPWASRSSARSPRAAWSRRSTR